MSGSVCVFCDIINNKEKKEEVFIVSETEKTLAILDCSPVSNGHILLITKEHFVDVVEVDKESWLEFLLLLKKLIPKIKKNLNVENFNIVNNIGSLAEQSVFHLHIHLIPKYKEDEGFSWKVEKKTELISLKKIFKKIGTL